MKVFLAKYEDWEINFVMEVTTTREEAEDAIAKHKIRLKNSTYLSEHNYKIEESELTTMKLYVVTYNGWKFTEITAVTYSREIAEEIIANQISTFGVSDDNHYKIEETQLITGGLTKK